MAPGPERVGILLVSVWNEGDEESHMLARVTSVNDAIGGERSERVVDSPEEVLSLVEEWLRRFRLRDGAPVADSPSNKPG
jgi:hypothetical protein